MSQRSIRPRLAGSRVQGERRMASRLARMETETPWWRLEKTEADTRAVDRKVLVRLLEQLTLIRRFEERLLKLSVAGVLHGPAHSSIGQDGEAVGAISALSATDKI